MAYRYENIKKTKNTNNSAEYYVNTIYPDVPVSNNDQYVITTYGDRLDLLAFDIYKDQSLWWLIASANNLSGDSLYPPVGTQLRIPTNIQGAITQYKAINGLR